MDNLTIYDSKCENCGSYRRLTVNGIEVCAVDSYYGTVDDYILGFYGGLKYAGIEFSIEKTNHSCEHSCEFDCD